MDFRTLIVSTLMAVFASGQVTARVEQEADTELAAQREKISSRLDAVQTKITADSHRGAKQRFSQWRNWSDWRNSWNNFGNW